jgi:hypothetical protein
MGMSGQRHAQAAVTPGLRTPVPIVQEARCAPEPVQVFLIKDLCRESGQICSLQIFFLD